jgi:hypothetical protein
MSLPDVPDELTAKKMYKQNSRYTLELNKFYNECLKLLKKGESKCSLNSEDVDINILKTCKQKLEEAGYKVEYDNCYDLFIITNPYIPN